MRDGEEEEEEEGERRGCVLDKMEKTHKNMEENACFNFLFPCVSLKG